MAQSNVESNPVIPDVKLPESASAERMVSAVWPPTPTTGVREVRAALNNNDSSTLLESGLIPDFQLTGFDQEASKKHESIIGSVIGTVKNLFEPNETLSDQVKAKVIADLNPHDKRAYDDESLEANQQAVKNWSLSAAVFDTTYPKPIYEPLHTAVAQRTVEQEEKIATGVETHMTPEERKRLSEQFDQYEGGDKPTIINPFQLVGGREKSEPGNAIKDYWDRIREATDSFTRS
jgi:hypothetical protein